MTKTDLHLVLGWATDEGWNPGRQDLEAFYAADPDGFFIKEVDGVPVAAISVVNHDPDNAFLGLYLCQPEFRGQGHGMDVWRAGLDHAEARCVGLDGVPDQQANYARSGFVHHGATVRYQGMVEAKTDPRIRVATEKDMPTLLARDTRATGVQRFAFSKPWFAVTTTRQTFVLVEGSQIIGLATFRQCHSGLKVGPLHAATAEDALTLLSAFRVVSPTGPLFIDVPGSGSDLANSLKAIGFEAVFETARMFKGPPPIANPPRFYAIATMELG